MNKKYLKYGGIALGVKAAIVAALFAHAFLTLKSRIAQKGELDGFHLYLDGIVIDRFKIDPSIDLTQVYLHGFPWQLLWDKPEYVSIAKAEINADQVLSSKTDWPFNTRQIDISSVEITKTILDEKMVFTGSAKQSDETPLLVDFSIGDEKRNISGKAEIRTENDQVQAIDINFDEVSLEQSQIGMKRGTGWLSYSYEEGWQVVGEMDAGIALLGPHQFYDATLKLTGMADQPQYTFAGKMEEQQIITVDRQENGYVLHDNEKDFPVEATDDLNGLVTVLDNIKEIHVAEAEALKAEQEKQAEEEKKKQEKEKKKAEAKKEAPKPEVKAEKPPEVLKIETAPLSEIRLFEITSGTSLAGFIYPQPLQRTGQPCPPDVTGQCWTASSQGGSFSYNPQILPAYFLQMKDYEQVKMLKTALLNFNVENITIHGKDKTARKILLKGTTADNQPAEIQLVVLGLE